MAGGKAFEFLAGLGVGAGVATLLYGALVESKKLELEKYDLQLEDWPKSLNGMRIAVLGDLHLRDKYSVDLAKRAIALALSTAPDMIVLAGDLVGYWKPESEEMLEDVLTPLLLMQGAVVAVPGNHEYWSGSPERLRNVLAQLQIKLLINEHWHHAGVTWVGIDSFISGNADPEKALAGATKHPMIALWHEPDVVPLLPPGCSMMISGHSHGGQFKFGNGFTPMFTHYGSKYPAGFYPDAETPLFVTRGIGTTGPPCRFNCSPEVAVLTISSA